MSDEESKEFATVFFRSLNYEVTPIPTAADKEERRADLFVEGKGDTFVVEAKAKAEHADFLEHMQTVRETGSNVLTRTDQPWNALSSKIRKAAQQLQATPAAEHAVRLLWVSCLHSDARFVLEAVQRRLLGNTTLTRFKRTGGLPEMLEPQECYFYGPADFPRFPAIDGAILASANGAGMVVNEFGARSHLLSGTQLHADMFEQGCVLDPAAREAAGNAMVIRDRLPGQDHEPRRQYLIRRYGVMTAPTVGRSLRADMAIRAEDLASSPKDSTES